METGKAAKSSFPACACQFALQAVPGALLVQGSGWGDRSRGIAHPLCPGRRPICEECRRADKHSERSRGNEESPGHRSPMNAEAEGECEGRKLGWWGTGRSVCISEWGMRLWGSLGQVERGFRCVRSWMFSCSSGQRVRSGKDSHTHETPAAGGEGEWPCLGSTL